MSSSSLVLGYSIIQQKQLSTAKPAIDAVNDIIPPLDYSFCRLTKSSDIYDEEPRNLAYVSRRRPVHHITAPCQSHKSSSKCLRLNNNALTDIESLTDVIENLFENPTQMAWLDLSFNELTTISTKVAKYENLQILYLHGNHIADFQEVEKLTCLRSLRKLTLHGNGVENEGYRFYVLSLLPWLQELDFSPVTKADRATASTWKKMNVYCPKRKKGNKKKEKE